ncbi:hypothetical protein GH714_027172 [Hevea brasiliensis]|uniref:Uncharacterized protein n=1 Tax=Hevea brasiliensis TaxID=3981 RepID=A0A6A6KXD4_HEVBR|nr:hypothetical protein GH714_027172 [Hevea brasiliensis]
MQCKIAIANTQLVCGGDLAYLGGSWSKTVGSDGEIPLQGDFSAEHMIFGVEGIDPARREKLIDLLDIDLLWHVDKVLLLNEDDLDVVASLDLLEFSGEDCEQRGATLVYATDIFDGSETWATYLACILDGELIEEFETKREKKKPTNPPAQNQKTSSPWICGFFGGLGGREAMVDDSV